MCLCRLSEEAPAPVLLLPSHLLVDFLPLDAHASASGSGSRCVFVTDKSLICLRLELTPGGHQRYQAEAHIRLACTYLLHTHTYTHTHIKSHTRALTHSHTHVSPWNVCCLALWWFGC